MTAYRIKWTLSGESVVHEAHDAEQAQDAVEVAVARAGAPVRQDGAEVDHTRWHYARESTGTEDG